ncbi:aspartate carbamoyltransferase [Candidatus Pacearchaeota archaeon]|nr:aspartate carbamoyltransferase [Candidatus Pacearchaeota archaeon]
MKHLLESQQLDKEILFELFKKADDLRKLEPENLLNELKGKILATLFYEPSTRTRFSFESAMLKLGGEVISTENAKEFSSAVKGESIEDTIRIISSYADCIVIRHYEDGAAKKAAQVSRVPVINGGDGKGQHPTQALLDVYTIYREIGRLDNFKIAIVGDLSSGRTVRSLCYLLSKFTNIEIIFVSPENLRMREDIKQYLNEKQVKFREEEDLNKILEEVGIIYMTRIQKERISQEDYEKACGKFIINLDNFNLIKKSSRLMHPLPHVEEICLPLEIEQQDERVAYFRQAENGLYIRMALLLFLLKN